MRTPEEIVEDMVGSVEAVALDVYRLQAVAAEFVDAHAGSGLVPSGLVDLADTVRAFPVLLPCDQPMRDTEAK